MKYFIWSRNILKIWSFWLLQSNGPIHVEYWECKQNNYHKTYGTNFVHSMRVSYYTIQLHDAMIGHNIHYYRLGVSPIPLKYEMIS